MAKQYDSERVDDGTVSTSGFFRLDRMSSAMLVLTGTLIAVAYAPLLTGAELTIAGQPWLLLSQPIVMIVLGAVFVTATYYVERADGDDA
ncbi:hypothetical protein [Natronolimnohabitans innermongolicus]|uniref:Uncharacterized protein n=1 Tax=Natronolimnohabitans innermongolicus JCM 12255 TaxID=1227499 RepID=L9WN99_9EURY|nr:hypothetical protein [Natronolimnohabitans innermongolicus]ELY50934.1 hypothetical protein C493_18151 [Natronolimnohabitans innermongolicus JCM 12255]